MVRFTRNHEAVPLDPPDGGTAPAVSTGFSPAAGAGSAPALPRQRRPAPAPRPWLAGSFATLAGTGLVAVLLAVVKGESSLAMLVPGGKLIVLGRLAGITAAYLILIMLLLVARLPWLERAVGQGRLVWWHRRYRAVGAAVSSSAHVLLDHARLRPGIRLPARCGELWVFVHVLPGPACGHCRIQPADDGRDHVDPMDQAQAQIRNLVGRPPLFLSGPGPGIRAPDRDRRHLRQPPG